MPRFHNTQDGLVQFTQEEEDARDAEEAEELAARPMNNWLRDIAKSDAAMPRWVEDLWDAVGVENAPQEVKDNHAAKKTLRGQKP